MRDKKMIYVPRYLTSLHIRWPYKVGFWQSSIDILSCMQHQLWDLVFRDAFSDVLQCFYKQLKQRNKEKKLELS